MANQGYGNGRGPNDWDSGFYDQDSYQNGYYDPNQSGYQDGYYDQSQDGYYDPNGDYYYQDDYYGGGQDAYYDGGYDQNGYDQSGYTQQYYEEPVQPVQPRRSAPSMAARAAGRTNTDPYARQRTQSRQRTAPARQTYTYEDDREYVAPTKRRRRKRRHPFRNFLIFLLVLAAIVGIGYFALFQAPNQTNDGWHTRKAGFYNILVGATDAEELRTDTMMILSLDNKGNAVSLTSIPRDIITSRSDTVLKLNGIYGYYGGGRAGAEALLDEVQTMLGFRPDGYAIINYQVFKDVVNALGGVTFDVPMDMTVDDTDAGGDRVDLSAGEQVLDGDQALAVCRYRYGYLMADIQRQFVQQSFLKAMIKQAVAPKSWLKLPAVYNAVLDNMVTDLSGANLRYLALHALLGGLGDIQQNTLPGEGVNYGGASCYGLFGQSVADMVNEVMNPYEETITMDEVNVLTVSDGQLVRSTWSGVAFDASSYDYGG